MPEFSLPSLAYSYDALDPHIDARTMEIHHTKHHQTYITNLNNALKETQFASKELEELLMHLDDLPENIRTAVRNNGGGHWNHTLFWKVLGPEGGAPSGKLDSAILKLGGMETLKSQLNDAALKRFGSGWAWLMANKDGSLSVTSSANQDTPLSAEATPIFGIDVWEHAYYLNYQNRRADYLNAVWNVVNWKQVGENYERFAG